MGWWGKEIMAGDTPADYHWDFRNMLGLDAGFFDRFEGPYDDPSVVKKVQRVFTNDKLVKMIAYCEKQENGSHYEDYFISYQVLAVVLMEYGLPFPDYLRGQVIEVSLDESWAQQEDERADVIVSLIDDVLSYEDGIPKSLTAEDGGLFGKIATILAEEPADNKPRVSLLNVFPPTKK